jgi:hypothetical protein
MFRNIEFCITSFTSKVFSSFSHSDILPYGVTNVNLY